MGQHACLGHAIVRATLRALIEVFIARGAHLTNETGMWNVLLPGDLPDLRISW